MRPGGDAFTPYALLVIASVLFSVARDLLTSGVGTGVPTLVIASASASIVTLSSLGFSGREAADAVDVVAADMNDGPPDVPAMLRRSIQLLGRTR